MADDPSFRIAVVSMACRYPGADTPEALWRLVEDGQEALEVLTGAELEAAGVTPAQYQRDGFVPVAGRLAGVDCFDAELFGLSPREADLLDPQQRLLLACAWEAFEAAARVPDDGAGRTGVFVGTDTSRYLLQVVLPALKAQSAGPDLLTTALLANEKDHAATRIAYRLGLTGPCVGIQTACSTSLVAVHFACQSLLAYECDRALAGGASILWPLGGYLYREGGPLSPDGHVHSFDAEAAGTVFSSGVGMVLLKRYEDARRDGDVIRAMICGSAVNNDGAQKVGYTAPSPRGQAQVIAEALQVAGVEPGTIGLVEAHGTATPLGDPIEVAALREVFAARPAAAAGCALGSCKSNIGHTSHAAGVAGLIKTVFAVERGVIPPSLHFERPNPELQLDASPFYVPTEARPWPEGATARRAGVSSFGIGGTNAHVIVEQAPPPEVGDTGRASELVLLSARTPEALQHLIGRLREHLRAHPGLALADVSYSLAVGRRPLPERCAVVCTDTADLLRALEQPEGERWVRGRAPLGDGDTQTGGLQALAPDAPAAAQGGTSRAGVAASQEALATSWVRGGPIDAADYFGGQQRRRLTLPTYPFAPTRHWFGAPSDSTAGGKAAGAGAGTAAEGAATAVTAAAAPTAAAAAGSTSTAVVPAAATAAVPTTSAVVPATAAGVEPTTAAGAPPAVPWRPARSGTPSSQTELADAVREETATVLGRPAIEIDAGTDLVTLGLDSYLALELAERLQERLGVSLAANLVWEHRTVQAVAEYLRGQQLEPTGESSGQANARPSWTYELVHTEAQLVEVYHYLQGISQADLVVLLPLRDEDGLLSQADFVARWRAREFLVAALRPADSGRVSGLEMAARVEPMLYLTAEGIAAHPGLYELYTQVDPSYRGRFDGQDFGNWLRTSPEVEQLLGGAPVGSSLVVQRPVSHKQGRILASVLAQGPVQQEQLFAMLYSRPSHAEAQRALLRLREDPRAAARLLALVQHETYNGVSGRELLALGERSPEELIDTLRRIVRPIVSPMLVDLQRRMRKGEVRFMGYQLRWLEPFFLVEL